MAVAVEGHNVAAWRARWERWHALEVTDCSSAVAGRGSAVTGSRGWAVAPIEGQCKRDDGRGRLRAVVQWGVGRGGRTEQWRRSNGGEGRTVVEVVRWWRSHCGGGRAVVEVARWWRSCGSGGRAASVVVVAVQGKVAAADLVRGKKGIAV